MVNINHKKSQGSYCPPEAVVLEVKVEQGFAGSNEGGQQLPSWEII